MKIGILGFPNVGKKTLFKLLTNNNTISLENKDSLLGTAKVRDERYDKLVAMYDPKKQVPATIEFSLFKDLDLQSAQNTKILQTIQLIDVLCHVVRDFDDESIFHLKGSVNAARDIEFLNGELIISDLLFIEKRLEKLSKDLKKSKDKEGELLLMLKMKAWLEEYKPLRNFQLSEEDKALITSYPFLTLKPMIVIVNISEKNLGKTDIITKLEEQFKEQNFHWLAVSVKIEQELSLFDSKEEQQMFLDDLGITIPAIDKFTMVAYKALGLISFFTVGKDEVRAWMVAANSKAPQASRVIHTDMERGFIRMEVMKYEELMSAGSENKLKETGKYYVKGKEYVVEDGDIISVLFNV